MALNSYILFCQEHHNLIASLYKCCHLISRQRPVSYTHLDLYKRQDWDDAYISTKRMVLLSCGTDTLEQIHQYILEHYAEDLSLDYLAEHFGLSLSYLSRSFKKRYHNGLINFLTEIRINKAIVLMKDHSSSIAELSLIHI